jgi:hypothetical protein
VVSPARIDGHERPLRATDRGDPELLVFAMTATVIATVIGGLASIAIGGRHALGSTSA